MLTPRCVLFAFMKEMNMWERQSACREHECDAGKMDYDKAATLGTSEYMDIFTKYCSSAAIPREYFFTEPPDYDPVGEVVLGEHELSAGLIEILTQQSYNHRKKHIFRMAFENGEWKIIERKIVLDTNEVLDTSL
jgi:hypothetical protein